MQNKWKKDFPILERKINNHQLVYLDNSATSQMPRQVLNAVIDFETNHRANVHRGIHTLSEESTDLYEQSREKVAKFIGAVVPSEIVFVRNTTEGINLVAHSWGKNNLGKGDIILTTEIEHHSDLVPWQIIAKENGCRLEFIPLDKNGMHDIKNTKVDWSKVKLVALSHVSNVLGTIIDIKEIVKYIKKRTAEVKSSMPKILIDGAQSVPHMHMNVQKLGIDFLTFSGHKMCAPMGIGVLWISRDIVSEMGVYLTGGGMIDQVEYRSATYAKVPEKFEAGTPNVSGAIGLAAACDYLSCIGMDKIREHEIELTKYAIDQLKKRGDTNIFGITDLNLIEKHRAGVVSFNLKGIASHDVATVLNVEGVAVRSGHHCVMPWHIKSGANTTLRASFYFYNDKTDVDALIKALYKAKEILGG